MTSDTFLALVPKCDNPEHISQFRPIPLCNVIYKIITKIIANRLKHFMKYLIGHNHSSFILGRQILDNIIIMQEVLHMIKIRKGRKGMMLLKLFSKKFTIDSS